MESQPQNPEFRINPKNFHPCISSPVGSTLFIQMDYPMYIDTISMELSIVYFKVLPVKILSNNVCLFLKIVILANSADPDEMLSYAPFYLDLHCLPKYLFMGIQNKRVNIQMLTHMIEP